MKHEKNINPVEEAFYYFIHNNPDTFHPCDRERFYSFVLTIVRYSKEGAKWFNKEYFYQRLSKYLKKEDIDAYRRYFDDITDFLNLKPVPVFKKHSDIMFDSPKPIYEIKYVEDDKLHIKQVDKETFENTNSLKRAKAIK